MSLLKRIVDTECYKSLNSVQKNLATRRQNRLQIENGYEVAKNIGFEKWKNQTQYNHINTNLVGELINQDSKNAKL